MFGGLVQKKWFSILNFYFLSKKNSNLLLQGDFDFIVALKDKLVRFLSSAGKIPYYKTQTVASHTQCLTE